MGFLLKKWEWLVKKSDDSTVNMGDLLGPIKTIHHNAATLTASQILGTDAVNLSGKKVLSLSIKVKPGASFSVKFWGSIDGVSFAPIQGFRKIDFLGSSSASGSNVVANNRAGTFYEEQWDFDIPGNVAFGASLESLSGTNATITITSEAVA